MPLRGSARHSDLDLPSWKIALTSRTIEARMSPPDVSSGSSERAEAESAWIELYRELNLRPEDFGSVPRLRKYTVYQRAMIEETLAEIDRRLKSGTTVSIWSAGSGIDTISLYLKSVHGKSTRFTLQDISQECMSFNKEIFSRSGLEAEFVVGDLFESKYHEEFDIVINTGLLEHFTAADQSRLLKVFSDALRPGGVYLTATPFTGAKLYSVFKKRMEAKGTWKVGPETPIPTLEGVDSGDLVLSREYQVAARDQLIFLRDAYPRLGRALQPFVTALRMLPNSIEPPIIKAIGGYCLLDKFSKGAASARRTSIGMVD
jgi:SAM-dependent methyltransferase